MKSTFQRSIVILLIFLLSTTMLKAQSANLTIKITGIEKIAGKIQIGIYNDARKFPDVNGQYKVVYTPVNSNSVTQTISLPTGVYAIALYHDEDADGECDDNFLGIPTEKYGFSNNVKPVISAPSFDDAKIELKSDKTIQISLVD